MYNKIPKVMNSTNESILAVADSIVIEQHSLPLLKSICRNYRIVVTTRNNGHRKRYLVGYRGLLSTLCEMSGFDNFFSVRIFSNLLLHIQLRFSKWLVRTSKGYCDNTKYKLMSNSGYTIEIYQK